MFYCPQCGNEVLKSYPAQKGQGPKFKLRTNILIWEDGRAFCKCQKCHAEVPIPVTLELPTGRKIKHYIVETKNEKLGKEA